MAKRDADVVWPRRAVVTAGMPTGTSRSISDTSGESSSPPTLSRALLRDRIGKDNVRFVSGTDCFGSPIDEGYRKAVENDGFSGTIAEYVMGNHERQAATLASFDVEPDIFEGSGIGHAGDVHQELSYAIVEGLAETGHLSLSPTLQFFDEKAGTFLNGRQVVGRCCPVQGCKADAAYADECSLGHQYSPADLSRTRCPPSPEPRR